MRRACLGWSRKARLQTTMMIRATASRSHAHRVSSPTLVWASARCALPTHSSRPLVLEHACHARTARARWACWRATMTSPQTASRVGKQHACTLHSDACTCCATHPTACYCVCCWQPGGLIPTNRTGSVDLAQALKDFDLLFELSLSNTGKGGRGGGGGGSGGGKGGRGRSGACLYQCAGVERYNPATSEAVAHLAGSPLAYRSDNPADARAGVNLLGGVVNQGSCATCITATITSAATAAAAAALRVDGRSLAVLSQDHPYFCIGVYDESAGRRSCSTGWSYEDGLRLMAAHPAAFFMIETCLGGANLAELSTTKNLLHDACVAARSRCGMAAFKCGYVALSEGVWYIMRWIRSHGSALTRIKVTAEFKEFFEANRTGVFNASAAPPEGTYFWHAVLLVGGMGWMVHMLNAFSGSMLGSQASNTPALTRCHAATCHAHRRLQQHGPPLDCTQQLGA